MWEREFSLSVLDKPIPSPDSHYFEVDFVMPLLQEAAQIIEDKRFAKRIIEALELKPNIAGIGVDLKALLFPSRDQNA